MGALHHIAGYDAVGGPDDARLLRDPKLGLDISRALGHRVLELAQGVEHLHHGDAPSLAQLEAGHSG